ncbi:MAG: hypothetical protein RLZZ175_2791 [Bacteroidota bacterium]|jgi:hypothetical protein
MSNELDDKINEAPGEAIGEKLKNVIGAIIEFEKSNNTKELVIRTGNAPDLLKEQAPLNLELKGSIYAPAEYAKHRANTIDASHSYVEVSENQNFIRLVVNDRDPVNKATVVGTLTEHAEARLFGFNEDASHTIQNLRDKFKKLRHYFASQQEFIDLMAKLNSFNAKIETIQKDVKNEQNGSTSTALEKKINSEGADITYSFKVKVRLFQDVERKVLLVELYPIVSADQVKFQIACVEVYEVIENLKFELFEKTLADIPSIPVFNV